MAGSVGGRHDPTRGELRRKCRQAIVAALGPTVLDADVPAFDVTSTVNLRFASQQNRSLISELGHF
jgi:hypothetical protein